MKHAFNEIRENPGVALMAGFGASVGFYKYYLRPNLTAKRAWGAMALGIGVYELAAPQGQLLSEGVDRALEAHPMLTRAAIGLVACHLVNILPERFDPLHQTLKLFKGVAPAQPV